jgi:predicted regulator of Ras-like GTPase activity (Roadblock/LC7/MglB family)
MRRSDVFDMLTRDELCTLHTTLYHGATHAHRRLIGEDGRLVTQPCTTDWDLYSAVHAELAEAMEAVDAELDREQAQEASVYTMDGQPVARRIIVDAQVKAHHRHQDYLKRIEPKGDDSE